MEVIFIIGSNTKETHPVIANRMIKAVPQGRKDHRGRSARRSPWSKFAEVYLKLRPGTDIALLNGMAHVIVKEGLQNDEFIREKTEGFDAWKRDVARSSRRSRRKRSPACRRTISSRRRGCTAARASAGIFYTMGITQHTCGTDNVRAIANLATLTGNIGREFTGVNPLRGQNNVQGASDAACLPNVYPGYQKVDLPEVAAEVRTGLGRAALAETRPHRDRDDERRRGRHAQGAVHHGRESRPDRSRSAPYDRRRSRTLSSSWCRTSS